MGSVIGKVFKFAYGRKTMTREEASKYGKEQLEIFGGKHREFIDVALECIEKCEHLEYILRLNRAYIDRVKNSGLGKHKAIEYIDKHFVESTSGLIDWSCDDD